MEEGVRDEENAEEEEGEAGGMEEEAGDTCKDEEPGVSVGLRVRLCFRSVVQGW